MKQVQLRSFLPFVVYDKPYTIGLMKPNTARTKIGRPPTAIGKDGKPLSKSADFGRLTISMRNETRAKLDALAAVEHRSAWEVVEDALCIYASKLGTSERKIVEALCKSVAK